MANPLFTDTDGNLYLIPFQSQFILGQVGMGGDLGVFDLLLQQEADRIEENPHLLFRVHFGRVSPRRHNWKSLGLCPFLDELYQIQKYSFSEIGGSGHYLVAYGLQDEETTYEKAAQYEPLATWSHEHIVKRFAKESRLALPPEMR